MYVFNVDFLFGNVKIDIYYFCTCIVEHRAMHFYLGMTVGLSTVISSFLDDKNLTWHTMEPVP